MFSAGAESLLQQARGIQAEELGRFCGRITKQLQNEDWGPDTLDSLRRLFLIVSATKYSRKLQEPVPDLLQAALCSPACPEHLQLLCAAILREMAPTDSLGQRLCGDHVRSGRRLSLAASVLLAQGDRRDEVRTVSQRACECLGSRHPEGPGPGHLLPLLAKVTSLAPGSLHEDQTNLLHKRLGDWLRYASVQQAAPPSSGGFFTPRTRQPGSLAEVDGALATDFFTVLCSGRSFPEDQRLSVQAFSLLRSWLRHSGCGGPDAPDTDDRSDLEGSTLSVLSAAPTASGLLPPRERLREKAFEYCQRLVEQSGRRALRKADSELQKACLVEAVLLLDQLCRADPSFLYRSLACLRALQGRLCGDPACVRALLPVAQFYLNHGEAAAVGAEAVWQALLSRVPAEHFHSPALAFELVRFCRDSAQLRGGCLERVRRHFPNLLKFLAWNSPPLVAEFVELLPWLVDVDNALEMFHTLLDLPCLTAALDLQLRTLPPTSERPLWDASLRVPLCLDAFRDPQFQHLFQYLLRPMAGGTPERSAPLYPLLQPMAAAARVMQCAEAAPTLLGAFFSAVNKVVDETLSRRLALALLERSGSLFPAAQYEARVHRVLGPQLLALFQLRPELVLELAKELLEFVGSGVGSRGGLLTCVVWAVGEYVSVPWNRHCTVEHVNQFFETLEALLFELTQSRPSATTPLCPPQVVTALMTALTKLASRSQDLIPRASLLLSKTRALAPGVGTGEQALAAIGTRATELLNLLKMPSVAQFVLTPSMDMAAARYHRDTNTALPLALGAVRRLLDREGGMVPAGSDGDRGEGPQG
ncbi:AP-5 complex subunit zeta-1 isoform X1 [Sorex araneus]|uniref:AP-5 complex subunit zeta-1 isoform X1 n=2 Tax=Sorex araneus TaxID=42254 RepID=UPI002433FAAE|nr:AP-5 complex subunit zeta-1 isoform X1 [Sorex araneus]